MKYLARLISLLLCICLLAGCARGEENISDTSALDSSGVLLVSGEEKQDDNYRTWYEIFVYSYCDSDGDGIGDLQGVISKLDELESLGISGIWLMPVHPSTTYHKYNVSDYYEIDPAYGTLADMEELLASCEERGISVILDLVVNHTGSEHEWFKEAVSYLQGLKDGAAADLTDPSGKYVDYYTFVQEQECPAGFSKVDGTSDWYYESRFSYDMPDLNLANSRVRDEIEQIMKFWLDKGAAGFRLDAAKEFYSGNMEKNLEVLNWIQQTATALKPGCYLVAEVWDNFNTITKYYASDITSIFNYAFGNTDGKIIQVLRGAGNPSVVSTYATALEKADTAYRGSNEDYIDAPFLSNHDIGRIAGFVSRDEARTKLAGAMNLFMSGSAFIYYGEEIGMVCGGTNDPSFRAPMYWNEERNEGTTNMPPECTLPEEYPFGSLEEQKADGSSIYNYYRHAIAIRNALPVISHGKPTAEAALNAGCVSAYRKTWGEDSCIILMNINGEAAEVDLSNYTDWTLAATLTVDKNAVTIKRDTLKLPAYGTVVLIQE